MAHRAGTEVGGLARRKPRVAVDLPAALGGRTPVAAHAIDLSYLGCLVRSATAFAPGSVVDLRLDLPDGLLQTKARVALASIDGEAPPDAGQRFLTGLEFMGLAAAAEQRLRRFVDAEAKRRRSADTPAR